MKRRQFVTASLAATGFAALSGCTGDSPDEETGFPESDLVWDQSFTGGFNAVIDHVSDGRVIVRVTMPPREELEGSIVAFDVETGDQLWAQGNPPNEYDRYESINLEDALYAGYGDDQIGGGSGHLVAIELDGELRWENDTGSIYSQPSVGNGIVSAGNDMGVVYAFDANTGEEVWTYQDEDALIDTTNVVAITDTVYANVGKPLAFDTDDGSVKWSYGTVDDGYSILTVEDNVTDVSTDFVYLRGDESIVAVVGGEKRWEKTLAGMTEPPGTWGVKGIVEDYLVVQSGNKVHGLDAATGEQKWVSDAIEDSENRMVLHEDRVYALGAKLHAFDTDDGSELWNKELGGIDGPPSLVVNEEGDEHAIYAKATYTDIHRISLSGEITWSETFDENIWRYAVDKYVFVTTGEGIYALNPQ